MLKNLYLMLAFVLLVVTPSCRTFAGASTPPELKSVPTSQSVALEVAIEKIQSNDGAWVDVGGNVKRDAILSILTADKAAWDQLDAFYNK